MLFSRRMRNDVQICRLLKCRDGINLLHFDNSIGTQSWEFAVNAGLLQRGICLLIIEALDREVLQLIADSLRETMECPICLSVLRPPVTLCSSGHGVCPDCKPSIEACPVCREEFIATKPIILHQLLDALPRECQYKSLGCSEVCIPGGNHEKLCSFRTVDCKVMECDWSGQARRLLDHLSATHADLTVVIEDGTKHDLSWEHFNYNEENFKYIPYVTDNQVFWAYVYMSTQVNKLCISFTHAPIGVSNFQYIAIISFKKGNVEFTHTINIPLDTSVAFDDFLEDHCMMIPRTMLSRLIGEDSSLGYSILVTKEKI